MQNFWRRNTNWDHIGATTSERHPADPRLPPRPKVPVRAIGPRRFIVDGLVIPEGEIAFVSVDDAPMLVMTGKAERVE